MEKKFKKYKKFILATSEDSDYKKDILAMNDDEFKDYVIAVHEAGHTVMAFLNRIRVECLSIIPNEERHSLGHTKRAGKIPEIENGYTTLKECEKEFIILLAGEIAKEFIFGEKKWSTNVSPGSDMEKAVSFSGKVKYRHFGIDFSEDEWIESMIKRATVMMKPYENAIKAIAKKLIQRKKISGQTARKIFKEHPPVEE